MQNSLCDDQDCLNNVFYVKVVKYIYLLVEHFALMNTFLRNIQGRAFIEHVLLLKQIRYWYLQMIQTSDKAERDGHMIMYIVKNWHAS